VVEVDRGVISPKPLLNLFASDKFACVLQQQGEHLEWLALDAYPDTRPAKFASFQISFEDSETDACWSFNFLHNDSGRQSGVHDDRRYVVLTS
jgi:hypothetical protein